MLCERRKKPKTVEPKVILLDFSTSGMFDLIPKGVRRHRFPGSKYVDDLTMKSFCNRIGEDMERYEKVELWLMMNAGQSCANVFHALRKVESIRGHKVTIASLGNHDYDPDVSLALQEWSEAEVLMDGIHELYIILRMIAGGNIVLELF